MIAKRTSHILLVPYFSRKLIYIYIYIYIKYQRLTKSNYITQAKLLQRIQIINSFSFILSAYLALFFFYFFFFFFLNMLKSKIKGKEHQLILLLEQQQVSIQSSNLLASAINATPKTLVRILQLKAFQQKGLQRVLFMFLFLRRKLGLVLCRMGSKVPFCRCQFVRKR